MKGRSLFMLCETLFRVPEREGLKYRTINTIISAVSMTNENIEGVPMGKHH